MAFGGPSRGIPSAPPPPRAERCLQAPGRRSSRQGRDLRRQENPRFCPWAVLPIDQRVLDFVTTPIAGESEHTLPASRQA